MKQQLSSDKPITIKTPEPRLSDERLFSESFEAMIALMGRLYKKQVIEWMSQNTINKFADDGEQIGNFANVFTAQSKRIKRKLLKRFSNKRIEKLVRDRLGKVDRYNQDQIYSKVEKELGISTKQLIASEGLKANTNALILETLEWAKRLRDNTLLNFTTNTLQEMALGGSLDNLINRCDEVVKKDSLNAKFLARNQIQNFNGISTKIRAQNLGITEGIWHTSRDERVRTSHKRRDGKRFLLAEGLNGSEGKHLIPSVDFNCRCTVELIIPEN